MTRPRTMCQNILMGFNVTIQNIGKLDDAKIRIGEFTVLAGPNNTGKSTVSKLLYSLFDGMNANHAFVYFKSLVRPLETALLSLNRWEFPLEDTALPWNFLNTELAQLEALFRQCAFDNLPYIDEQINLFREAIEQMATRCSAVEPEVEALAQQGFSVDPDDDDADDFKQSFEEINDLLGDLRQKIAGMTSRDFVIFGLNTRISQNLTDNFQASALTPLLALPEQPGKIEIEGVGEFSWGNGKGIDFSIDWKGLHQLQRYSRVLYLESPTHWKLQTVLERSRMSPRFFHLYGRQRVSEAPAYVFDSFEAIRNKFAGEGTFRKLYEKLISSQAINGKLVLSDNGELLFAEKSRQFPLSRTAMGVINLGLLALLIERGVLDAGTFLFIDEPEAHLHPAWQHVMAESLLELARHGVNVVIATHSPDILKSVEAHLKRRPDDRPLIAVNRFPPSSSEDETLEYTLAMIQGELTAPYATKYFEGL